MSVCACVGPIGSDPVCPCRMREMGLSPTNQWNQQNIKSLHDKLRLYQPESKPGFFPLPIDSYCSHPEHNVPSHLYVPAGQGYRHICPQCGYQQTVVNTPVTMEIYSCQDSK